MDDRKRSGGRRGDRNRWEGWVGISGVAAVDILLEPFAWFSSYLVGSSLLFRKWG